MNAFYLQKQIANSIFYNLYRPITLQCSRNLDPSVAFDIIRLGEEIQIYGNAVPKAKRKGSTTCEVETTGKGLLSDFGEQIA